PLRRLHEPLPGVHPHRRPGLWHRLSGADRQDHLAAPDGPGKHPGPSLRLITVRRLRRGLSGEDSHSLAVAPPARGEREEAGRPPPAHARPGQQVLDLRAPRLAGLALAEYLAGAVPAVRLLRHAPARPDAEHRPPGAEPQQRSEEHTSELQSRENLVCRLLLAK